MYRVYYKDGTEFEGDTEHRGYVFSPPRRTPHSPPYEKVVAILQVMRDGTTGWLSEEEYYYLENGVWKGGTREDVTTFLQGFLSIKEQKVKKFRHLNNRITHQRMEKCKNPENFKMSGVVLPGDTKYHPKIVKKVLDDMKKAR